MTRKREEGSNHKGVEMCTCAIEQVRFVSVWLVTIPNKPVHTSNMTSPVVVCYLVRLLSYFTDTAYFEQPNQQQECQNLSCS